MLRFITEYGSQIDYKDEELANKMLDESGFVRFNKSKIFKSQRCSAKELKKLIYESGTFKYIYNIKQSAYTTKNIGALKEKILNLENDLLEQEKKTWTSTWIEELEEFEKKYQFGKSVDWNYNLI